MHMMMGGVDVCSLVLALLLCPDTSCSDSSELFMSCSLTALWVDTANSSIELPYQVNVSCVLIWIVFRFEYLCRNLAAALSYFVVGWKDTMGATGSFSSENKHVSCVVLVSSVDSILKLVLLSLLLLLLWFPLLNTSAPCKLSKLRIYSTWFHFPWATVAVNRDGLINLINPTTSLKEECIENGST